MRKSKYTNLPRLSQLLDSPVMARGRLLFGEDGLAGEVGQVVTNEEESLKRHCFYMADLKAASLDKVLAREGITALCLTVPGSFARGKTMEKVIQSRGVKAALALCRKVGKPLFILPEVEDFRHTVEGVRSAFAELIDLKAGQLHKSLFNTVLDQGIEGLVSVIHEVLRRPVALESADFKLLASSLMKSTPVRQRKSVSVLALEMIELLGERTEAGTVSDLRDYFLSGERLVVPLIYGNKQLVGYISVSFRKGENPDDLLWLLRPAGLAAMVDLVQRSKTDLGLSTASKSMLRDLMVGQSLSSLELEKVERHFGFDLYDGFYIFAVDALGAKGERLVNLKWPEEKLITVEVEGSRLYVAPFHNASREDWKKVADDLFVSIRSSTKVRSYKLQLGAARPVETILEFHEAYRQARQALIIGSMLHKGEEYAIAYGDLGLMRLLYLIVDHPELELFYQETLGPLEAYDQEWDTDLMETLKVYVEHGANLNSSARALFVHRNTMRYRLEQIEEDILKVDIDSEEVLLNLRVAYLIKELINR